MTTIAEPRGGLVVVGQDIAIPVLPPPRSIGGSAPRRTITIIILTSSSVAFFLPLTSLLTFSSDVDVHYLPRT